MNTRQIQALDRQRTVVVIPGGILEEHGPYLSSYSDRQHLAILGLRQSGQVVAEDLGGGSRARISRSV
jgi:hypothetical protein